MKRFKEEKGITLIALVITIIVLLILAGVTIATLTGENGTLNQASKAVEKNKQATEEEQRTLAKMEARMNTENTTFQNVTIPAGFAPTKIEGESTVDEGLVIIDEEGNEFVWVPVPDISKFKRVAGYSNGSKQSNWSESNYTEPFASEYSTEQQEYEKMLSSVTKNGGFYIGRYETGIEGGELKQIEGNTKKYWDGGKVIVQKDVNVYNYIGWSDSNDMKNETGGAVEKAKEFKKGKAYEDSVTSTLIYGIQWDATMQFFDNRYIDGIPEEDIQSSYVTNSTGKGNYGGGVAKTGSLSEYKVKNIYDMAGNVYEWTMEAYNTGNRVNRGGNSSHIGSETPVSCRNYDIPSNSHIGLGFRIALYVEL